VFQQVQGSIGRYLNGKKSSLTAGVSPFDRKIQPTPPQISLLPYGLRFHLQQTEHDESDTCHQGDYDTDNKNDVNDGVVFMLDISGFRVSMDLFPQHDDLQELKVHNIGR
jgi:hypothetical protein